MRCSSPPYTCKLIAVPFLLQIRSSLRNWHKFFAVLRPGALTIYNHSDK